MDTTIKHTKACQVPGCTALAAKGSRCAEHETATCVNGCANRIYWRGLCTRCYHREARRRPCSTSGCPNFCYSVSQLCRPCLLARREQERVRRITAEATQRHAKAKVATSPTRQTEDDCALWGGTRCPECDRLISCHARLCTLWIRALRAPGLPRGDGGAKPDFSRLPTAAYHDHMFSVAGRDLC